MACDPSLLLKTNKASKHKVKRDVKEIVFKKGFIIQIKHTQESCNITCLQEYW